VRERIEYRFRVPNAAVFTLYSYSKALEYRFRVPTAGSLKLVRSASAARLLQDADSGIGVATQFALSQGSPLFLAQQRMAVAYGASPALLFAACMRVEREKKRRKNRV
jgi:hypothetical protein